MVKLAALVKEEWRPPKARRQRVGISAAGKRVRRDDKRRAALKKQAAEGGGVVGGHGGA